MGRTSLTMLLFLAGCGGSAPAVQSPDRALQAHMPSAACSVNLPPAGYGGPRSPHVLSCPDSVPVPDTPANIHDYRQGMPPRAVSGQKP